MVDPDALFYHRLVESFKWAYAARTKLGDPRDLEYSEQVERTVNEMVSADWARDKVDRTSDSRTQSDPAYYGAEFYNQQDSGTAHLSVVDKGKDVIIQPLLSCWPPPQNSSFSV